ncbi:hypothetical protein D5086_005918 [Populus alba]|uniref:Uncharacterized protein n=1 Tax=Populus alba TaxID=43335 RepID=A0ACC4CJM0_POPAL
MQSTSHQDKGNAITSLATNTDEMSSEESDSSGETDTDSSDETDTDESASDSSDESQLKPYDLGDVNPINSSTVHKQPCLNFASRIAYVHY